MKLNNLYNSNITNLNKLLAGIRHCNYKVKAIYIIRGSYHGEFYGYVIQLPYKLVGK